MAEDSNNSFGSTNGSDVASTIVGGLFNIGSGFLNNYFGKKVSKKEYKRAIELWNMQNEYNKPINQMARLREAGLNPNLVAGSLSNSVAGAIHAPSKENLSSPLENLDLVGSYQDLRQKDAQIQNIKAQTKLIKQQAKALGMENNENNENGTSRSTPYPVKVAKQVGHAIKESADTLSSKMNQAVPSSFFVPFDYLDKKFINFTNTLRGRKGQKSVPSIHDFVRGKK